MKITLTVAIFLGLASGMRLEKHSHHRRQHHHKKHQKLAQYKGNSDAWIDDCDPERDVSAQTNPSGAGTYNGPPLQGSYPGVGVECQGFAQKKSRDYEGGTNAWVNDCAPGRNPFIAGNGNAGTVTSYPGVGIECQGFSQHKKSLAQKRSKDQDYAGGTNAWIDDCAPGRNPFIAGDGNAGTGGSYPGVGIECQGFSQKKHHSLAQARQDYEGGTNAWIDDCSPDRVMNGDYGSGTQGAPGALPNGSFEKVGVECQGFAQRKSQSLAQGKQDYEGGTNAWIDDCSPDRVMNGDYGSGTQGAPGATSAGSYTGVGVECQGFAQKKAQSLAQAKQDYEGGTNAWIDDCDPNRDPWALKNPSGAGTYEEGQNGSFPGVGVECQGFAQRKAIHNLAQLQSKQDYEGGTNAWIDDCDANRDPWALKNPSGAGTYEESNGGSFPGVGVECQGFAQIKSRSQYKGDSDAWVDDCNPDRDVSAQTSPGGAGTGGSYPGVGVECQGFAQIKSRSQYKGDSDAWVDDCNPDRDVSAQTSPGGAGTGGSYPGVGVECQGFAQRKSHSLAQQKSKDQDYAGGTNAWIDDCNPDRDVSAQTSPGGAGTGGSYPGVGVECQGFAQKKSSRKLNHRKHHFLQKPIKDCSDDMPDCNGTNGTPGVDCCDE